MQVYRQFNVDVVPPAFNFIKNESRHRCLLMNFEKKIRTVTLLKTTLWHSCFSLSFADFLRTSILLYSFIVFIVL